MRAVLLEQVHATGNMEQEESQGTPGTKGKPTNDITLISRCFLSISKSSLRKVTL